MLPPPILRQSNPGHPQPWQPQDFGRRNGGGIRLGIRVTAGDERPILISPDNPVNVDAVGSGRITKRDRLAHAQIRGIDRYCENHVAWIDSGLHRARKNNTTLPPNGRRHDGPCHESKHGGQNSRERETQSRRQCCYGAQLFCTSQVKVTLSVRPWIVSGAAASRVYVNRYTFLSPVLGTHVPAPVA